MNYSGVYNSGWARPMRRFAAKLKSLNIRRNVAFSSLFIEKQNCGHLGDRAVLAWRWPGNLPGIERTWHFWRAMRKSSGGQRLTCFIVTREFQPGPVMCGNRAKSKRPFLLLLKNTLVLTYWSTMPASCS
jgi:hypothetical protein